MCYFRIYSLGDVAVAADLLLAYGKQHTDIKERQCTFMMNLPSTSKPADHATVKCALKQAMGLSF